MAEVASYYRGPWIKPSDEPSVGADTDNRRLKRRAFKAGCLDSCSGIAVERAS